MSIDAGAEALPISETERTRERTTFRPNVFPIVRPTLSVTVTTGEKLPSAAGVPVMIPVALSIDSPEGRPVALHLYGAVPPAAVTVPGA